LYEAKDDHRDRSSRDGQAMSMPTNSVMVSHAPPATRRPAIRLQRPKLAEIAEDRIIPTSVGDLPLARTSTGLAKAIAST
jgi:hypothetical protein